jgi:hypothetical protein
MRTARSSKLRPRAKVIAVAALCAAWIGVSPRTAHANWGEVKITEPNYDFGSEGWDGFGAPWGPGDMHFHEEANGVISPHLLGYLHINNASGACARMHLDYYTEAGDHIVTEHGGEVCAGDNSHHHWRVDLQPFESADIYSVEIAIDARAGSGWRRVGSPVSVAIVCISIGGGGGGSCG